MNDMNDMNDMIDLGREEVAFRAYLSRPAGACAGALILVHEVWGLVDHIKRVADRFAAEGYLVLAPDLISPPAIAAAAGTTQSAAGRSAAMEETVDHLQRAIFDRDPAIRTAAQPKLRELLTPLHSPEFGAKTLVRLRDCFEYLARQLAVNERIGIVGFCFGGTQAFSLAVEEPRLKAAVAFYGHADFTPEELRDIRCPILAFYGEKDTGLMDKLPDLTRHMTEAGIDFQPVAFAATGHAFFNDTNPYAYDSDAAAQAWRMSLDFLEKSLHG